jgi:diguanylate cyclase
VSGFGEDPADNDDGDDAGDDAGADMALSRRDLEVIVRELDRAAVETAEWLARFHRSAVCKVQPDPDLVADSPAAATRFGLWYAEHKERGLFDQPAFEDLSAAHHALYAHAAILAKRAWKDDRVPVEEYDALLFKITSFNEQAARLSRAFRAALSDLDPLTGTHTRQSMERDLAREQNRALRTGQPCCIALADIDHFKHVNDTYGHIVGDRVLAAVTRLLMDSLRPYDSIFRFGGEEFLLCLPDTGPEDARRILDRVRRRIEAEPMTDADGTTFHVTTSFGVAQIAPRRPVTEITDRADRALYLAKRDGRNQVRVWTAETN